MKLTEVPSIGRIVSAVVIAGTLTAIAIGGAGAISIAVDSSGANPNSSYISSRIQNVMVKKGVLTNAEKLEVAPALGYAGPALVEDSSKVSIETTRDPAHPIRLNIVRGNCGCFGSSNTEYFNVSKEQLAKYFSQNRQ